LVQPSGFSAVTKGWFPVNGAVSTPPLLISIDEAARLLSLGRTRIYELIDEDRLTAVKAGKRTLILTESMWAYVASLPRRYGHS
jgi:excisionase family DNA binding protein